MKIDFKTYIQELQNVSLDQLTEHSKRSALENLLKQAAQINQNQKITVLQEPKRKENYGSPDFKIFTESAIIGYVENKKITENLEKILQSEQIKKYRELSKNLLLTNYIDFVWIKGETIQRESLCSLSDIENKNYKGDEEKQEKVEQLLLNFFSQVPEKITNPDHLAIALAVRCRNLKDFIYDELERQSKKNEQERLYDLYDAFKNNIFSELSIAEFADAFAQMLTYGMFLAGLNADTQAISLDNVKKYIPSSFQLIKELINFLDELEKPEYQETKWIIDEIVAIINHIEWATLQQNMSFKKRNPEDWDSADPYIYFYETFLAAYDYKLRKAKGVYYTPPQAVNFIVRTIDEILTHTFQLPNGLAEHKQVTVLDFATGTGTFLLEIFRTVLENLPQQNPEKRKLLIKEHLLQNLYGFEYLIAPYTVAHLKLSQFLKENGYELEGKERLQVYLTNTLEPVNRQVRVPFMPQLSKETQSAQAIKDKPILVITGNPPYSYASKNNSLWISNKIKDYYKVNGAKLNERNPKGLQDDYVKFIRFAQDKMDKVEQGVVGIITNHSFLDNPTFRGMRQSLMSTFDQLHFIDLHGNSRKKETTPEGGKDENIFDIQQGICISILVKKKGLKKGIFHTDFWGSRKEKLRLCVENSLKTIEFAELQPNSPFYLFVPQNHELREHYESFWSIKDIFNLNSVGVVTGNDELFVDYEEKNLQKKIQERFKEYHKELTTSILYRPFDVRKLYYDADKIERSRKNIMINFQDKNVALISVRQVAEGIFNHAFITSFIPNFRATLSNKGGAFIFPLYILKNGVEKTFFGVAEPQAPYGNEKEENGFIKTENFTSAFRKFINQQYQKHYSPEQILAYVYAMLYSETYRTKYAVFLKMDFPHIPFTEDLQSFENIVVLGEELIERHLMRKQFAFRELADLGNYPIEGDNIVVKPEFKIINIEGKPHQRLYINPTQYFETVPKEVYEFHIGGYQVLDKYLKDRKGRSIAEDLFHITEIIKVIYFTIKQMAKIDEEIKRWI
jgi:hypothetical protein